MSLPDTILARRSRAIAVQRAVRRRWRWEAHAQSGIMVALVLIASALTALLVVQPAHTPFSIFQPVVVIGGLFLTIRWLRVLYSYLVVLYALLWVALHDAKPAFTGGVVILLITMAIMGWVASVRSRVGVQGVRGETMLLDLRDQLRVDGRLPDLPEGWAGEAVVRPAYGQGFSGDFMVAAATDGGHRIDLVLVDVSGKGMTAGARALQLQGALSGLIGAVDSERFLPAANGYLARQDWDDSFATAAHVVVDAATGRYTLGTAGHPSPMRFHAGSGRWFPAATESGPILGVVEGAEFPRCTGVLERGDALLLYTDGVVESRGKDLLDGIDRMVGTAERAVRDGFSGLPTRLVDTAGAGDSDDRAVVLLWRR
ncbi:MAG: serine/threonine-protein phosphatase [Micrococcales bacterium]|nr:serine/threonine-protein phosphatase [Micrococcales bacterium]